MAGVSRRDAYVKQVHPYSTPWAVNVRGTGVLESRSRGGCRPGLSKVSDTKLGDDIAALFSIMSLDGDGAQNYNLVAIADGSFYQISGSTVSAVTSEITTYAGVQILTEDGDTIIFDSDVTTASPVGDTGAYSGAVRNGKLLLADSVLKSYDPISGIIETVVASSGTIPAAQPVIALYRDRVFISGVNNRWYCSRQSDIEDWNFNADLGDVGRAVAGQLSISGMHGNTPTAMIPMNDQFLVFACVNSLWVLRGDPTTGGLKNVSSEIGVIAPNAWAKTPEGLMIFLSNDGVYLWGIGSDSAPIRMSEEKIPESLKNVDASANIISMEYDPVGRGFHLFLTPSTGTNTHYWIDIGNKAIWPVLLASGHQPNAIARIEGDSLSEVVLGCDDGYLRKFDTDATDDDGTALASHVLLGPFKISTSDTTDAILSEIHGSMADLAVASSVTWSTILDSSAEAASDTAVKCINDSLDGNLVSGVSSSGSWGSERHRVSRPRDRGMWCVIWLHSTKIWSYENIAIISKQLGRMRNGN